MPIMKPGIFIRNNYIICTMEDDILKDEDDLLDSKIPHEAGKNENILDGDPESIDELAEEEEEEEEEPFDDVNLI